MVHLVKLEKQVLYCACVGCQVYMGNLISKLLNFCNSINIQHFLFILHADLGLSKQYSLSWWLLAER